MRRVGVRLCSSPQQMAPPARDLRSLREERVATARETIFGPQGSMPGDRYYRKKLEGRNLRRWYFPSKYHLQDFRNDEYFEMQAERFAPRKAHKSIPKLDMTLARVVENRDKIRTLFEQIDEHTFFNNPTLQDLFSLYRLVDPNQPLSFNGVTQQRSVYSSTGLGEEVFKSDGPLCPLFFLKSGGSEKEQEENLYRVINLIKATLSTEENARFRDKIYDSKSIDEIRGTVFKKAIELNIAPTFEHVMVPLAKEEIEEGTKKARFFLHFERPNWTEKSTKEGEEHKIKTEKEEAQKSFEQMIAGEGPAGTKMFLERRHRFVDPMFRRRRLKWLERQLAEKNKPAEVKFNESYYATHPDEAVEFPNNKGSVTITWPSPYH